ncbi:MAG: alpha/beta fold hydrolase [Actinomycetota bacterium]|nr:MAG: alpha/beta fold hydrolase [Actinomycetota bacterium]
MGGKDAYFSAQLDGRDAVLMVHGFTGSPHSLLGVAKYLETGGLSVALPLLPGHGTSVEDLFNIGFDDWYSCVVELALRLLGSCTRVDLFGLSMGGALVLKLLESFRGFGRAVLVNPLIEPPAPSFIELLGSILKSGINTAPGIASDIARPDAMEFGYPQTPIRAALSMFEALPKIVDDLGTIENEILLFSSRQDHVVPSSSGDLLAGSLDGAKLERLWLEKSFHVATLDFDADFINSKSLEFFRR